MERPETYDPWDHVQWLLTVERDLYVRIEVENPKTKQLTMTLMPFITLSPQQWVYWGRRLFFDHSTPVFSKERWRIWEKERGEPAAADYV